MLPLIIYRVRANATGSISDMKVGWNTLSMAVAAAQLTDRLYNQVSLTFIPDPNPNYPIEVLPDRGTYNHRIPSDPEQNLAAHLTKDMLDRHDSGWENRYRVQVETVNNIPSHGLNASGATVSATARAIYTFLSMQYQKHLSPTEQTYWAIHGEEPTTGSPVPPNTVSASMYGGMTISEFPYPYRLDSLRVHKKFVPSSWMAIFAKPPELEATSSTAELRQIARNRRITGEYASEQTSRSLRFIEAVDMIHPNIGAAVDALRDYDSPFEKFMADGRVGGNRRIFGFGEGITYAGIRENDRAMAAHNIATVQSYLWRVAICDPVTHPESVASAKEGLTYHFSKAGYPQVDFIEAKLTNVGALDSDVEITVPDRETERV